MDTNLNPFTPGAGCQPPELAGRDEILEQAAIASRRAVHGRHARSAILLGPRGMGKTVLLKQIEQIGQDEDLLTSNIESPENTTLVRLLVPEMRRVLHSLSRTESAKNCAFRGLGTLRNFAAAFGMEVPDEATGFESEPGLADNGDLELDLPHMFDAVGIAARAADKGWLLLMDEIQHLPNGDLSALIASMHRVSRERTPILLFGAGLPQFARMSGNAKPYAERLFSHQEIGPLNDQATRQAVQLPLQREGRGISDAALDFIVENTRGYPFLLQEWAFHSWNLAEEPEISRSDVVNARAGTMASLDQRFFMPHLDRLSKSEVEFVKAMASLGDGPHLSSDVAAGMDRTAASLSPARSKIIAKGVIYSPGHGNLDFTAPLFADFLNRHGIPDQDG